jgi:hypothetical protein
MSEYSSKLIQILKSLTLMKFFDSILIKFENGKIVHIKKEESIKIS